MRVRAALLALTCAAAVASSAPTASAATVPVPLNDCVDSDNGDPVITSLAIAPRSVDLAAGSRAVTVTVSAEDTGGPGPASGIAMVSVYVARDGGGGSGAPQLLRPVAPSTWQGQIALVPGTDLDGAVDVEVNLRDRAGNGTHLSGSDLKARGFETTLAVRDPSTRDVRRPGLSSFHLSRTTVDARDGARRVVAQARVHDDLSGVGRAAVAIDVARARLHLVRGDRRDGLWRGTLRVGRWVGSRDSPLHVTLVDRAGNASTVGATTLRHHGFPHELHVLALTDVRGPVPRARSTLPPTLDVRAADAVVPVRVLVTDDRSGTSHVAGYVTDGSSRSPSARLRLVSGSSREGIWQGSVVVPHCTASTATYRLGVRTTDNAGVSRDRPVTAGAMAVTAADHSFLSTSGAVLDWSGPSRFRVSFAEDVVGVSAAGTVVTRTDFRPSYATTVVPATWMCFDASGAAVDCIIGPVRSATVTLTEAHSPTAAYQAVLNPEHVLDVRDLAGNPPRRLQVHLGQEQSAV